MCAGMIDLKKAMTRIMELEEELKSTRDGYEEKMTILVEKNDDLTRKLGVFMEDPTPGGDTTKKYTSVMIRVCHSRSLFCHACTSMTNL